MITKPILIQLISLITIVNVAICKGTSLRDDYVINKIKDTTHLYNMNKYLDNLMAEKKADSVLFVSEKMICAANEFEKYLILGNVYVKRGEAYSLLNEYFKAAQSYKKAIEVFKNINDIRSLALVYESLYFLEYYRDNLTEAADYLLEAKTCHEKVNDLYGTTVVLNYLGDVYSKLDKFELSEEYYKKAIKLRDEIQNKGNIGLLMNNLAYLYINHGMPQKSNEIVQKALKINKQREEVVYTIYSYYILGKITLHQKEYKTSEKYYDTVLNIGSRTKHFALVIPMIISKQQLGKIALETKDFDKADQLLKTARKEFLALKDIDPTSHLLENYEIAAKLDYEKGNLEGVIEWQKKYQQLSDEKIKNITSEKIKRAEDRHKSELERLKMLDEQNEKERESEAKLFKYKTFAYAALGIMLIILVFLIAIIRARKERKRLITKLDQSNQVKNKLFSIISHDLKNEIHGLEGSLNLMKDDAIPVEDFKDMIPIMANRTHQTSILLNNLLNWSKSQLKELNANPIPFDISEVIQEKFTFFTPKAIQKDINLVNKLTPTQIYADKDMFSIVAQNLIANAIKFCNPGDTITLYSEQQDDHYKICFKDTGIGIAPQHVHKLFEEETYTTKGTQNESGTGLGLKICKELIEHNMGTIEVESKLGEGSTFCILLPKAA